MQTLSATVTGKTHLELCQEVPISVGSRVRVQIEEERECDLYAARLKTYYDNATEEMLAEERNVTREWTVS